MASVGSLYVNLVANTAKFRAGMGKAGRTVAAFRKKVKGLTGALGGMVPALAAVGSVSGLGLMVKRQMESIDATAKLSDQLGVATEDLQKLRHAAELTGAGSKSLDAGLATMAKRLGEAARGSGAAAPALKELGLEAKALVAMKPDQAFREIAKALEKIEEPARRNAIAANLFSKANMGLLNTLAAGEKGLAAMGAEAERLGKTFGRVDAAKIEAANDAMTKMGTVFSSVFQEAAIGLAPLVEIIGEDLVKAWGDAGDAADKARGKMSKAADAGTGFWATVADVGHTVANVGKMAVNSPAKWTDIWTAHTPSERMRRIAEDRERQQRAKQAAEAAAKQQQETASAVLGAGRGLASPALEMGKAFLTNAKDLAAGLREPLDKLIEFDKRVTASVHKLSTELSATFSEGMAFAATLRTPLEQLGADLADLDKYLAVGALSQEMHQRGVDAAWAKFRGPEEMPTTPGGPYSVSAMARGSAAAYSTIVNSQSPEVKAVEKGNAILEKIEANTRQVQDLEVVNMA